MSEDTNSVNRRTILRTTGVGAGLALGVGAGQSQSQVESTSTHNLVSDLTGELFPNENPELFLTVDADNPRADTVVLSVDSVTFSGEIYDDETWESENITVPDNPFSIKDDNLGAVVEGFNIPALIEGADLDDLVNFIVTVVDAMDLDASQRRVPVDLTSVLIDEFNISTGSKRSKQDVLDIVDNFLENPNADDLLAAIEIAEGLLGVQINEPEDILGLLGTDPQGLESLLAQTVSTLPEILLDFADVSVDIPRVGGRFEPNGVVTVEPEEVNVDVTLGQIDFPSFTLNTSSPVPPAGVTPTTGRSGGLTGTQEGLSSSTASLQVVDNEFILGLDSINFVAALEALNLPSLLLNLGKALVGLLQTNPEDVVLEDGDLIELLDGLLALLGFQGGVPDAAIQLVDDLVQEVNADVSGVTLQDLLELGDIERAIEDFDFPAIAESADLKGLILSLSTDESGRHATGFNAELNINDPSAVRSELRDVESVIDPGNPEAEPPRDLNDDGRYEAIRGNGDINVLDVQTFFSNLDTDPIQNNPDRFNFQGTPSGRVGIIDVQALWNQEVNDDS